MNLRAGSGCIAFACAVAAAQPLAETAKTLGPDGFGPGEKFGTVVLELPGSILVSAPAYDDSSTNGIGRVFVYDKASLSQVSSFDADSGNPVDFGRSMDSDGNLVIVGTRNEGVYIFDLSDPAAPIELVFIPKPAAASSSFGAAVALDGSTIVIGAPSDRGVLSNGSPATDPTSGSAFQYTFSASPPSATLVREIPLPDDLTDAFGEAVAVSGNIIAIGDPSFDRPSGSTFIDDVGRVTLHDPSTGLVTATFGPSSLRLFDRFGASIDIAETDLDPNGFFTTTMAVGAPSDLTTSGNGRGNGRVFLFLPDLGNSPEAEIVGPGNGVGTSDALFGAAINLGEHYLAIGAPGYDSGASGPSGTGGSDGTAYIFDISDAGSTLGQVEPTDLDESNQLGASVAISESTGTLFVGSPFHDEPGTTNRRGASYAFQFRCDGPNAPSIEVPVKLRDCNRNAVPDFCEIAVTGGSDGIGGTLDTDANGVLDLCEFFDCSSSNGMSNGVYDAEDINMSGGTDGSGGTLDCNSNGVIDTCEIDGATTAIIAIVDTSGSMNDQTTFDAVCDTIDLVESTLNASGVYAGTIPVFGITDIYAGCPSVSLRAEFGADAPLVWRIGSSEDWADAISASTENYAPFQIADRSLVLVFSDEGPENGGFACDAADNAATVLATTRLNFSDIAFFGVGAPGAVNCCKDKMAELATNTTYGDWVNWDDETNADAVIAQRVESLLLSIPFVPSADCNTNGIEDCVEVANGTEPDVDGNGQPDGCQACNDADLAPAFGTLDLYDIAVWVTIFQAQDPAADLNNDGIIDLGDITVFVTAFEGGCP